LADVFAELNAMRADGAILDYAIGGALAALFHAEVTRTYDVDVFVVQRAEASPSLVTMSSLYEWCRARGFPPQGEHVLIHGVPVQFLSGDAGLEREAVESANELDYQGVSVRVISPEHLIALFVRAGGTRRRERIASLLDAGVVDRGRLDEILRQHGIAPESLGGTQR
jgi:hypothetical protein